ncbi:hypothetical protein GWI33_006040 [Rhynchophorus ferrugineus]|uniref:DUF4781 domain-containing protein n=1 Tax=Rhynchophorus ferrugineus TaxID=354439 RepID=A0A834ITQ3_RHYFE|nr:hypothetical protein GWI33_006040 [Rhynchophorus ferrugineus]
MEIEAINSCKNKLFSKGTDLIQDITLKNAISQMWISPPAERKLILLYLHNSEQSFSHMLCEKIGNSELITLLKKSFIMIGWDIEQEKYHDTLKLSLRNYINLSVLSDFITKRIAMAVCIMPFPNNTRIFKYFRGNISYGVMLDSLYNAENIFQEEIIREQLKHSNNDAKQSNGITSEKLQRTFAHLLCLRDYDRFEYDEHAYLKDKIGFALKGGTTEPGYDGETKKKVEHLYEVIASRSKNVEQFKDLIDIAFIFNCIEPLPSKIMSNKDTDTEQGSIEDITTVPIFVLRKCRGSDDPCRIFIDNEGQVYQTWTEYLTENKLYDCLITVPLDGRYQIQNDVVLLEKHLTNGKVCQNSQAKFWRTADDANLVAGIISGSIGLTNPLFPMAPQFFPIASIIAIGRLLGIASKAWLLGRGGRLLYNRETDGESSVMKSKDLEASINIGDGMLALINEGANFGLDYRLTRGYVISQGMVYGIKVIGVLNLGASFVSLFYTGYNLVIEWMYEGTPYVLYIIEEGLSLLFFLNDMYTFSKIAKLQPHRILKEFDEQSGRYIIRNIFNELSKDVISFQRDCLQSEGEIIFPLRKIHNRDEIFATLTKHSEEMNKKGIKFSTESNKIELNGISVDINEFVILNKMEAQIFLNKISTQGNNTISSGALRAIFHLTITNVLNDTNPIPLNRINLDINTSIDDIFKLLNVFNENTKLQLLHILEKGIHSISGKSGNYQLFSEINEVIPVKYQFFEYLYWIISYFTKEVNKTEKKYQEYEEQNLMGKSRHSNPMFDKMSPIYKKRAIAFFEYAVTACFQGGELKPEALSMILKYLSGWILKYIYDYNENKEKEIKRKNHSANNTKIRTDCKKCGGYYFQNK